MLNKNEAQYYWRDKLVVVTGAAGQIGSELVNKLLDKKVFVACIDCDKLKLENVRASNEWPENKTELIQCDITNRADVENAFFVIKKKFGSPHMLVNNAGASTFEPFLQRPQESIDLMLDTNLKGTINCTIAFVAHSSDTGFKKRIVNVASHYGIISPDPRIYGESDRRNSETYGATKAGIIQLSKYYAVHLAQHQINVNTVSPGGIFNTETPQSDAFLEKYSDRCPLGRMANTLEIIDPILFLLSEGASYINGHNLVVDGGMSAW